MLKDNSYLTVFRCARMEANVCVCICTHAYACLLKWALQPPPKKLERVGEGEGEVERAGG